MANLLSYQGNAALGVGSNPQIPVTSPNDNLKIIADTSRDIMLLDSERNMRLFNQKISDRNQLTKLILDNQVSTKDISSEYLPKFLDIKKDVEKNYNEWGGNPNDIKGFKKYQDAVSHLQDYAAVSQTNTAQIHKLKQQRAAETLPWKQQELDKWIDREQKKTKKDPWSMVDPYHNLFSFSVDPILKLYRTGTGVSYSPDGMFKYEDTYGDYLGTLKNAQNEYLNNGEPSEDMRQFLTQVEVYDPLQKKKFVEAINGQLQKYNQERGLQPGQDGYAEDVQLVAGPDNQMHIKADPATFSAKYSLANQEKYVSRTPVFNKDLATYNLSKEKVALQAKKLGIEAGKAGAYIRHLDAQTEKFLRENKDQSTQIEQQWDHIIDNINFQGVRDNTKKKKTYISAIFLDQLPENFQYINGPIVAMKTTTDKSGKVTSVPTGKVTVGKLEPFKTKDGKSYYIPRYVNPETGARIEPSSDEELGKAYRLSRKNGFPGDYESYLDRLLKTGKLQMLVQGNNGTVDYTTMYQSAKTLNNQGSKKGQENIENPPEDEDVDTTND